MKRFIYLDTDTVNSIIAQNDKGLVLETTREHEDTTGDENSKTKGVGFNGFISGKLWKALQAEVGANTTNELSFNTHSQTILKEIATKTLHDAAFDIAYELICNEYDVSIKSADLGSYIELRNRIFEFVDLVYFENLFSETAFLDSFKKSEHEAIQQQWNQKLSSELNRSQQRNNDSNLKKELKKAFDENDKKYDDMATAIKAIREIIPYNRMLVSKDGYLIPLEDKYFRDNPKTMGFKHGGYITCFGYITNVIGESSEGSYGNIFSQMQNRVNKMLVSMFPTKEKDLFVVHPIALYYGD